jgi:VWFA-related protein
MFSSGVERMLLLLALVAQVAAAQAGTNSDAGYSYRSAVEEVRLTCVATDQQNRQVAIGPGDLAVVDNETVIRQFRSFNRASENSVNLVALMDSSDSVARRFKKETGDMAQLISRAQWGPTDRVAVLTFGGTEPRLTCVRNCRDGSATEQLSGLKAVGLTPLFDAIEVAAKYISEVPTAEGRAALVVFSDGEDTISRGSLPQAIAAAQKAGVPVYAVDLNSNTATGGSSVLRTLARATGGLTFSVKQETSAVLASILDDLRAGYVLTYLPASRTEGAHWVRVLPTRNLGLTFRCRQGYQYGSGVAQ